MLKIIGAVLCMAMLLGVRPALADSVDGQGVNQRGYGSKGYVWNGMTPEQVQVMQLSGDAARGKQAYRHCQGCHKADGVGRTDGIYPRLTGQHVVVLIKQITDTRAGIRRNPKMQPFANEHAISLQDIADIATYLAQAQSPVANGKGDPALVQVGARLYEKLACADCHGAQGQGNERKIYPVLAAQHDAYLLNEMLHIQAGERGNAHPDMVKAIKGLPAADLKALASYLSNLPDYRAR